jgi:hypothetical protein
MGAIKIVLQLLAGLVEDIVELQTARETEMSFRLVTMR